MPDLRGQVLIITSSAGIGAATARLAAEAGARLLVASSDSGSGWELAQATNADCWIGDLELPLAADSIVSQCLSRFGRVDALFNAAGLSGRRFGDGPVDQCSDEGWETTITHNLSVTFRMCRAVVRRLLEQEVGENGTRGVILNAGSVLGDSPEPRHFATHAYAAAKGGVAALSRSMAAYYAPHKIRVNVIAPAFARTPASERSENPELTQFLKQKQPLTDGVLDAGDVAGAALFLLSDDARSVTGEVFRVDGGWSISGA